VSDSGYTLAETMVALAVIALAMSGLSAALQVVASGQSRFTAVSVGTDDLRRAEMNLTRLFAGRGPFRSDRPDALSGADHQFQFDCGQRAPCGVQLVDPGTGGLSLKVQTEAGMQTLPLRTSGPAHFEYQATQGAQSSWPPPSASPLQALRAISIVRDGADTYAAILEARLWTEETMTCEFDVVLQDCR
jgi:prepilin-type N-terminal cleavage/methylation domain-containing protein